jgi:hypothetical protein
MREYQKVHGSTTGEDAYLNVKPDGWKASSDTTRNTTGQKSIHGAKVITDPCDDIPILPKEAGRQLGAHALLSLFDGILALVAVAFFVFAWLVVASDGSSAEIGTRGYTLLVVAGYVSHICKTQEGHWQHS